MKKIIFLLLTLLGTFHGAVMAQEISAMSLGYCDGEVSTTKSVASSQKDIWVSGAIYVTQNELNTFDGCTIKSIRAGLASKLNIDSLVVWIRSSLDGADLATGSMSKAQLAKGWNDVELNTPYDIHTDGMDGMYIGYSFHQKSSAFGLSAITTPKPHAFYAKIGDAEWEDHSSEGTLCVEGMVYGDKLPKFNVALTELSLQPVFVVDKGTLKIAATVKNEATQTITGFDITTSVSGIDEIYTTHIDTAIAYKDNKTVTFTVRPAITSNDPLQRLVTVTVSKLNEGEDQNMSDNTLSDSIEVVNHDYTRNVLLEEFTTEGCTNCPRMAGYIKDALESGRYEEGRLNVICHHSGYYTDWLTTSFDTDYLWFFNGSTYAPAIMLDRDAMGGSTPVSCPSSENLFNAYVDYRMAQPAYVSLNISADDDNDDADLIHVTVMGSRSKTDITEGAPRISVFVVENNIDAHSQAGASNFVHQHVNRANNGVWGEELEWNGDDYSYSCDFKLRSGWKRDNLQIVAFIHNYDSDDTTNCEIANSASLDYNHWDVSGIDTPMTSTDNAPITYYTLEGKQMLEKPTQHGIYIVKKGNTVSKVTLR